MEVKDSIYRNLTDNSMLKPEWIPLAYLDIAAQQQPITDAAGKKSKAAHVKSPLINKKKDPATRPGPKDR